MNTMNKFEIRTRRIPVELKQIQTSFLNHGMSCRLLDDSNFSRLEGILPGPKNTPYETGKFKLSIELDEHYPFRPPILKFITPIYHPNIDSTGKICLDVLQMPPTGTYNPAITLESILLSVQLLLSSPNPDSPLEAGIADMFKYHRENFNQKATEQTRLFAVD